MTPKAALNKAPLERIHLTLGFADDETADRVESEIRGSISEMARNSGD